MPPSTSLAQLRASVRKAHINATNKISRNRKLGIELGESKVDPRRNPKLYSRYTRKQLLAQLNRLNQFNSPSSQFVQLGNRAIVTMAKWKKFKTAEAKYNKPRRDYYESIKEVEIDGSPIKDQVEIFGGYKEIKKGSGVSDFGLAERVPKQIASANSLERLITRFTNQSKPSYLKKQMNGAREQLDYILDYYGDGERLKARLNAMSDEQFKLFYLAPHNVNNLSVVYENVKYLEKGKHTARSTYGNVEMNRSIIEQLEDVVTDVIVATDPIYAKQMRKAKGRKPLKW